jgi:small subunit ribosomal protein S21
LLPSGTIKGSGDRVEGHPSRSGVVVVVKLRVRSGESIQDAVRRFRKLCERSGLRKEMRRKAYYEKPSERRRREELKRLRKARQAARV